MTQGFKVFSKKYLNHSELFSCVVNYRWNKDSAKDINRVYKENLKKR